MSEQHSPSPAPTASTTQPALAQPTTLVLIRAWSFTLEHLRTAAHLFEPTALRILLRNAHTITPHAFIATDDPSLDTSDLPTITIPRGLSELDAVREAVLRSGTSPDRVAILSPYFFSLSPAHLAGALATHDRLGGDCLITTYDLSTLDHATQGGTVWQSRGGVFQVSPGSHVESGAIRIAKVASLKTATKFPYGRIEIHPIQLSEAVDERLRFPDLRSTSGLRSSSSTLPPAALARIQLVVFDFDGVFTNNLVYLDQNGIETVACNRSDGLGIGMLRDANIPALVLSAEVNPVVSRRCEKLKLECVQGVKDKLAALTKLCADRNIPLANVLYAGNDVNDVLCMQACGIAVAPSDARAEALSAATAVLTERGGDCFVRRICELLIQIRSKPASSAPSDGGTHS